MFKYTDTQEIQALFYSKLSSPSVCETLSVIIRKKLKLHILSSQEGMHTQLRGR